MTGGKHKRPANGYKKQTKRIKYKNVQEMEIQDELTNKENVIENNEVSELSIVGGGARNNTIPGNTNTTAVTPGYAEQTKQVRTSFSVTSGMVNHSISRSVPVEVQFDGDSRSLETSICCADWFETCRKKNRLGNDSMHDVDLITYVRNELFPKLKFVMDARQLMFSSSNNTICYQICRDMKVKEIRSVAWWELYKNKIVQTLNNKRADVTAAMKRVFMSK